MRLRHIFGFLIFLTLTTCKTSSSIEGLWQVTSVTVGEDKMTPVGRWMRFHADGTQQSGNGWQQHSVGTWALELGLVELTIINTNGLLDVNPPFRVTVGTDEMHWARMEEGQSVTVSLRRIEELPTTPADQIMGLWKLETTIGRGAYFSSVNTAKASIHFRWDRRFVIETKEGKVYGVYNVHAHKPEVELIPYDEQLNRNFWTMQLEANMLTLNLLNTDSTVSRTFRRVHKRSD